MGAAKHLLANIGNRPATARRRTGQPLHGAGGEAGFVADDNGDDRPARFFLFIGDEIANVRHRHDRDFSPQPFGEPFLRGALLQSRNEFAFDFLHALQPVDTHEQRRVVAQLQ